MLKYLSKKTFIYKTFKRCNVIKLNNYSKVSIWHLNNTNFIFHNGLKCVKTEFLSVSYLNKPFNLFLITKKPKAYPFKKIKN